jgi:hypothetical protein
MQWVIVTIDSARTPLYIQHLLLLITSILAAGDAVFLLLLFYLHLLQAARINPR